MIFLSTVMDEERLTLTTQCMMPWLVRRLVPGLHVDVHITITEASSLLQCPFVNSTGSYGYSLRRVVLVAYAPG